MNKLHRSIVIALSLLVFASTVTACSGATATDDNRVVMLTVTQQCDYCANVQSRVEAQLRDAGYDVSTKLTDYDAAEQAQQVNQAISERPAAIMLWPADSTAAVSPIRKIAAAGIPVVIFDSQPTSEAAKEAWTAFTGPDNVLMGSQAAIALVQGVKEKSLPMTGQIAVITGVPGTDPAINRLEGFEQKLAEIAPGLSITTVVASESWDQAGAAGVAASIVNRIPPEELRGVFGQYDPFISAFIIAAKQAGLDPTKVSTVGVVCTPEGRRNIENGDQYASILQSPEDQATYAVDAAVEAIQGQTPDKIRYMPAEIMTKANVSNCAS